MVKRSDSTIVFETVLSLNKNFRNKTLKHYTKTKERKVPVSLVGDFD